MVQTGHSIAEFAHKNPKHFTDWVTNSNYLISLSVKDEKRLKFLLKKLELNDAIVVGFYEPDIGNQLTSICYYGTPELRKLTNKLKLALS